MVKITVLPDDVTFEADADTRLILALEDNGIDVLHRCGGYAGCTTCRVVVSDGEPSKMTKAELDKLEDQGNLGKFRLSCQILCDHDMTVEPLLRLHEEKLDSPGNRPKDEITPDPEWVNKPNS